ncbi:winged helix-turn-helix transcriptional regulator [Streptomyces sp. NBC_01236]|uniref:winged helix-turn-helix transcriptional regulator n=1 Tax=Streptomyces sp. NBC_01236 TaxID=2903789 RepID=UPI002E1415BF|nr:helix-turn-helix transcriptional regulator [Streptomyces sp. NBC_01236]
MQEPVTESRTSVDGAITRAFTLFGKRWSGLITGVLLCGPAHFSELRRAIPAISERMLSDRLTELGAAGLVVRQVDKGPPLRVSYRLTEAGAALEPALKELRAWAERHLSAAEQTPRATDAPTL